MAFAISLLVRSPHIGRPLSAHHEYCTALTLTFLHNWQDGGFAEHDGAPSLNFKGAADRYIHPASYEFATRDGALYYLSFPPLAYYVPYVLFKAIGIAPDVLPLTWFSLFCHLITIVFLALAIARVAEEPIAVIAAILYLFMPASAWFHGTFYMSDSFVQVMWAIHLYAAIITFTAKQRSTHFLWYYGISLALLMYTYWLGAFVAAVNIVIAIWSSRLSKDEHYLKLIPITIVATIIPIAITIWQYSAVIGIDGLMDYWWYRFQDRATMQFWTGGPMYHLRILGSNYVLSWLPLLLFIPIAAIGSWVFRKRKTIKVNMLVLCLTLVPVLIDHAVFLKHAGHDFGALKAGFFLCFISACFITQLAPIFQHPEFLRSGMAIVLCTAGIWAYYRINPVADGVRLRYDRQLTWGRQIADNASENEIVFAMGWEPEPQEQWYARRNLKLVRSEAEALQFLRKRGFASGVIFIREGYSLQQRRVTTDQR